MLYTLEKRALLALTKKYISEFSKSNYDPYRYENFEIGFTGGLRDLGFDVEYESFLKNHPEINADNFKRYDAKVKKAFACEKNIKVLGDFILYMARNDTRGCFKLTDIDFHWYIFPLKCMVGLCKEKTRSFG